MSKVKICCNLRLTGTGMSEPELQRNPVLTDYTVRDLNKDPKLPYEDNTFDVITNVVSVDYLNRPLVSHFNFYICFERDWIRANPQEYNCSAWKNSTSVCLSQLSPQCALPPEAALPLPLESIACCMWVSSSSLNLVLMYTVWLGSSGVVTRAMVLACRRSSRRCTGC